MLKIIASLLFATSLLTACTTSDDDPGPGPGPGPTPDGGPGPGPGVEHGDICQAPAFACGSGNNLVCVVDVEGDDQGVCRFSCGTFSDCLNDDAARDRFDTDCCDIANGGSVCGQASQWPPGSCH